MQDLALKLLELQRTIKGNDPSLELIATKEYLRVVVASFATDGRKVSHIVVISWNVVDAASWDIVKRHAELSIERVNKGLVEPLPQPEAP